MSQTTLASIKAAADAKYGSTEIDLGYTTVVLRNAIRLDDATRARLIAKQNELSSDDDDDTEADGVNQRVVLCDIIRIVAQNDDQADALLREVGDDLGLLMSVFEDYNAKTQAGEA